MRSFAAYLFYFCPAFIRLKAEIRLIIFVCRIILISIRAHSPNESEDNVMYDSIRQQAFDACNELCEKAKLKAGDIMVIGCSTSEVCGSKIGTDSNIDVAAALFDGIYQALSEKKIWLAAQCCEHLNRAIIVERAAVPGAEIVNVVPQPKAGGSFATTAYKRFNDPVAVEEIHADAGIDIGGTLIGMHIKRVAVPVRLSMNHIGEAIIICARTRPKFVGGARAVYDERLL
jgi:uncharacterized protein (TIGR01440 family)